MSILSCSMCPNLIDTDANPGLHDGYSDDWICIQCRNKEREYQANRARKIAEGQDQWIREEQ